MAARGRWRLFALRLHSRSLGDGKQRLRGLSGLSTGLAIKSTGLRSVSRGGAAPESRRAKSHIVLMSSRSVQLDPLATRGSIISRPLGDKAQAGTILHRHKGQLVRDCTRTSTLFGERASGRASIPAAGSFCVLIARPSRGRSHSSERHRARTRARVAPNEKCVLFRRRQNCARRNQSCGSGQIFRFV